VPSAGLDARDPSNQMTSDLLFTPYGQRDRLIQILVMANLQIICYEKE